jgi:hypothetical protein
MALIRRGDRSSEVRRIQEALAAAGFDPGPIDGVFGPLTEAAVRTFQEAAGLTVDGIVGPDTEGAFLTFEPTVGTEADATEADLPADDGGITGDVSPAPEPEGAVGETPGLLGGGSIVKVEREEEQDLWFAAYEWPQGSGNFMLFQFESLEQVQASIGDDFVLAGTFDVQIRDETFLQSQDVNVIDAATSVIGLEGSFESLVQETMFQTALDAGLRDPTTIGAFLSDPEIQLTLAKGTLAGWSQGQIQAEIRNTSYYQNVLYPGIENLFAFGDNPEALYRQYTANVDQSLQLLGVARDPDGTFRTTIAQLLEGGVDEQELADFVPTFIRAAQSPEYASVLNQWTERDLGESITFEDVFDVLAGTARADLAAVVESANLQFQAEQQGIEIDRFQIEQLARTTNLTDQQITANFTAAERNLLALGDAGLRRSGLTQQALISAAFGQGFTLEGKELSAVEISQKATKFAIEAGLLDDPKLQLFVGFNPRTGTPFRPGLSPLSPEGA